MAGNVRKALAQSLGFHDFLDNSVAEPYLNYIENQHHDSDTLQEYLDIFTKVVREFSNTIGSGAPIQTCINKIIDSQDALFEETKAEGPRRELITDTILNIIGVWITARSYFVKSGGYRQVELAYCLRRGSNNNPTALEESLPGLIRESGLIPSQDLSATYTTPMPLPSSSNTDIHRLQYSRLDSLETSSIKSTTLNAYTLFSLADTRISWTFKDIFYSHHSPGTMFWKSSHSHVLSMGSLFSKPEFHPHLSMRFKPLTPYFSIPMVGHPCTPGGVGLSGCTGGAGVDLVVSIG